MRIRYSFLSLLRDMRFSRVVAGLTIAAILLPVYQPLSAASGPPSGSDAGPHGFGTAPGQALSQSIRKAKGVLENADRALTRGQTVSAEMQELAALRKLIGSLDAEVRAEFEGVGNWLAERQLPQKIVARHENAVAFYREQVQTLLDDLALLEVEGMEEERAAIVHRVHQRLSAQKHEASQHPFNPAELPHEAQRPRSDNLPRMRRDDFLGAGLVDTPLVQFAALEGYRFDTLPGADDPAYLGESVEVKLSAALRAKAEELGHDPVAIYHWVRNHVEWLPTWGAVQDAELTLSARRGNAMDIASLLISLLRASGIPARYVHGTIEVPEDAFRNWIGGFKHIEEAMNYAASGGIPITGMITGGRISHVRLEHIWVEAAVDFLPSRGAVMREADTWLPLDASYKQYEFLPGLDISAITGLDSDEVLQGLEDSGVFNVAEGWLENVDESVLRIAQQEAEDRLAAHLQLSEGLSVGDVIGGRKTVSRSDPILPSGLPYRRAIEGARYASLPMALSPTIAFGFGRDVLGEPLDKVEFPWAELNNRKVTVSFRPATGDDQAALDKLIPETGLLDTNLLPSKIPAYLIEVIPELRVEEQLVMAGGPLPLGADLPFFFSVADPAHGKRNYLNQIVAGSYLAVGVIGGSVAPARIEDAGTRLRRTAEILTGPDPMSESSLTRETLLGDTFHAGLLNYFAQYMTLGRLAARSGSGHFQVTSSAGIFGHVPTVSYFFGIPSWITAGGAVMDLDRIAYISSTDGLGRDAHATLNFRLGALASGLEHVVPEQMFVRENAPGEGVSAVRAFGNALAEGQRLYHVTSSNQAEVLPKLRQNPSTISEIRFAVAAGREVLVHNEPVSVPGWKGVGYIIFDPETGAGAWKIAGGANGGFIDLARDGISLLWGGLIDTAISIGGLMSETVKTLGLIGKILNYFDMLEEIGEACSDLAAFYAVVFYMTSLLILSSLYALAVPGAVGFVAVIMVTGMGIAVILSQFKRACSV